jgi:hypothetical protein
VAGTVLPLRLELQYRVTQHKKHPYYSCVMAIRHYCFFESLQNARKMQAKSQVLLVAEEPVLVQRGSMFTRGALSHCGNKTTFQLANCLELIKLPPHFRIQFPYVES